MEAADTVAPAAGPDAQSPVEPESRHLGAPLYVAWQITNECNLACMHCIEESGPGKKFKDELSESQVFDVLEQMMALEIPYLSFSGGEPMTHPSFFAMVEYVCARNTQLKVETNGHYLDPENCARLARLGVKAMQVLTLHGLGEIETDIENRHGKLLLVVDPLKSQGAHFRGKLGVGREVKHARAFSVRDVTLAIESARIAIDGELHFLLAGLREVEAGKRGHWPRGLVTRGVPVLMMNQRKFHFARFGGVRDRPTPRDGFRSA